MDKLKLQKRVSNEAYAQRFPKRSKRARAADKKRRVELRERRWLEAYNGHLVGLGLEPIGKVERQLPARRRSRRRRRPLAAVGQA